jgi:uncharacterized membrane protein YhaH (DUF805 family)
MDNIDWGEFLFKFDGRINRAKYWIGVVVIYVVVWLFAILFMATQSTFMGVIFFIVSLASIWPGLAVNIKRWHDRDKSGWWIFIAAIPLVGPIWALIETGFLPGTAGTNQYGPDPLA